MSREILIVTIGVLIGMLSPMLSSLGRKAYYYLKNRPHKKRLIAFAKKQLEEMKKAGHIEDYKIEGVCFTCPVAHVIAKFGSRKAVRGVGDLKAVPPDEYPPPPRGA